MRRQFEIKDSGKRREFEGGAKRDIDNDKPRFDLIPITALQKIIEHYPDTYKLSLESDVIHDQIKADMWKMGLLWGATADDKLLLDIIWISLQIIHQQEKDEILQVDDKCYAGFHIISPKTYLRLANHYGGGAKKYDPWNWSRGMPLSWFYASLMRHIFAIISDEADEDHLSAIFFNAASILHFGIINRNDVDDITPRLAKWFPGKMIE